MMYLLSSFAVLPLLAQTALLHGTPAQPAPSHCANTRIAAIRMPTGAAHYESGRITLKNGASLQLTGPPDSAEMRGISRMNVGDRVRACYGPRKAYADAPVSRAITITDRENGQHASGLIGDWPGAMEVVPESRSGS